MNIFSNLIKSSKLSVLSKFTSLIRVVNVPFDYSLFDSNKWLRYPAVLYGYSYDNNLVIIICG